MSIQRRLYERMAKLDQKKDIQEDPPAHQNPLTTAAGGMKDAKNTRSMQAYYAQLKKDAKDKVPKTAAEREKERLDKRESVELDELKLPSKDAKGNIKSRKVRSAFAKGAVKAQGASNTAMDKATSRGSDIDDTIKHIDRSLDAENRRDDRNRKSRKESVDLEEKLQFKLKTKFKPSTARGSGTKEERTTIYDVMIDGVRVGLLTKDVSQDFNYGEGGSYMSFKILQPGSRNKYAETIQVDDVEDPNEFFKKLKANPRTAKRTIKAIKAHGVELTNLDSKHESVEHVEEAKVGDTVHLGHATKGGSGVKGKVVKIDGRNVHIKNDKGAMFKGPMDRVSTTEAYGSDEDRKRREQQDIAALHKKGDKAGIARIMAAKAKEKMRSEAIKYDSAGDSTGTVTGKGKRDRGPKGSRTSGEVKVKYKGSDTYKDGAELPIKANDIARLLKQARKGGPKYNSRNLSNPRLTRDHVEYTFDESYEPGEKYDEKKHAIQTRTHPHTGKKVNVLVSKRAHGNMVGKFNKPKPTEEGFENMTAGQKSDADRRLQTTRDTVAAVKLPSTKAERERYAKEFRVKRGHGKGVGNKQKKIKDLMLKGRTTRTEDVEVTESEVNKKDLRYKRTRLTDADERARRDRERQSKTEELLNVAEDMMTEAKDSYEVVAVKGSKVVAKMPAEKMDIKDAVAALTKMHGGADVQVHKNGKIVKMKG